MIYKSIVIVGCGCLIISGVIAATKLNSISLGLANIMIGVANLIFMLR